MTASPRIGAAMATGSSAYDVAARGWQSSRWFRMNLWLHRWCSLVATIPFLILCLTGTVLIFHDEIDEWLDPAPAAMPDGPGRPLADSVAAALADSVTGRVVRVSFGNEKHPGVLAVFTLPERDVASDNVTLHYIDIATATKMGALQGGPSLTGFLLELHSQWFLGPLGELIGGVIALLVLISLISGVVVYAPHARRVAFGVLRRGRGHRLLQLDLHNLVGMVVLGWALVVSVTGLMLGFSTVARGSWQMTALDDLRQQYAGAPATGVADTAVDIDRVVAVATAAMPAGWHIDSVIYPGAEQSTPGHYTVLVAGNEGLDQRMVEAIIVDAMTGDVARVLQVPACLKAILLSQPLHFGDYGGLPLKLLWTLMTWFALFITVNGAWLWWNRRRPGKAAAIPVRAGATP